MSRPKNNDLPPQVFNGGAWRGTFLPTLFQWAATTGDPFRLNHQLLHEAILSISHAIYADDINLSNGGSEYDDSDSTRVNDNIFKLVSKYSIAHSTSHRVSSLCNACKNGEVDFPQLQLPYLPPISKMKHTMENLAQMKSARTSPRTSCRTTASCTKMPKEMILR